MARHWQRMLGAAVVLFAFLLSASSAVADDLAGDSAADVEATLQQGVLDPASRCGNYRFRSWIRARIVCDSDLDCHGLKLDEEWEKTDASKPIVILLHGFNSCAQNNDAVMTLIRAAGFPCGSFSYPNDHVILASAQRLSCELQRFAERYPERKVVLVCHSMGGMVARACLEDPFYDPGNVDRLIMIAPPTHGTLLARFAIGTDLWEHWLSRKKGKPWTRLRDSIVDGLGEAADDLCPESEFLTELNACPRNPSVRYSIFLGTGATISEPQIDWIRESVCEQLAKLPGADETAERLNGILADIDELVEGKGDGVVAVKRGRLEGVSDTIVMPFGHLAVTGKAGNGTLLEVHQAVLERIQ